MTERQYTKALSKIVKYLESRGFTVKLDSNSFGYYEEEDLITCSKRSQGTPEFICSLLHEAGHSEQSSSEFNSLKKSKKRDLAIIIEMEYTAWYHGLEIAKNLDICTIELERIYRSEWLTCWNSYIYTLATKYSKADIHEAALPYIK